MMRKFCWLIFALCLVSLTACASKAATNPPSVPAAATPVVKNAPPHAPTNTAAAAAPTEAATAASAATATSGAAAAGGQVPGSCDDLVKLVGSYMGGVATTKSLGKPQHLSCEFANAAASTIIIVDIGVGGTPAAFDQLRATSALGGRTVTSIDGLGVSAFSVSKGGKTAGVSVLTAQGLVYVVESILSLDQDVALIKQLMAL